MGKMRRRETKTRAALAKLMAAGEGKIDRQKAILAGLLPEWKTAYNGGMITVEKVYRPTAKARAWLQEKGPTHGNLCQPGYCDGSCSPWPDDHCPSDPAGGGYSGGDDKGRVRGYIGGSTPSPKGGKLCT